MTAVLAFPLSAGALTRTFKREPSHPVIVSRDEPGTTLTDNRMDPVFLSLATLAESKHYEYHDKDS